MACISKLDYQMCLKEWKDKEYYASKLVESYCQGVTNIGIKKDLKAALKILHYWEKKCDLTKHYYFVFYNLYKIYQELGKTKLSQQYDLLYYKYSYMYSTTGNKDFYVEMIAKAEIADAIDSNGKIKDKKLIDEAVEYFMLFVETTKRLTDIQYHTHKDRMIKFFSDGKYKKLYLVHLINGYTEPYRRKESIELFKQFTDDDFESYIKLLEKNDYSRLSTFREFLKIYYEYHKTNPSDEVKLLYARQLIVKENEYIGNDFNLAVKIAESVYDAGNKDAFNIMLEIYGQRRSKDDLIKLLEKHVSKYKSDSKNAILLADNYFDLYYDKVKGATEKGKSKIKKAIEIYEKNHNKLSDKKLDILSNVYLKGHVVEVDLEKAKLYSRSNANDIKRKERIDEFKYLDNLVVKFPVFNKKIETLKKGVIDSNIEQTIELVKIIKNSYIVEFNSDVFFKLIDFLVENKNDYGCYLQYYYYTCEKNCLKDNEKANEAYLMLQQIETGYKYFANYIKLIYEGEENIDVIKENLNKAIEFGLDIAKIQMCSLIIDGKYYDKDIDKSYALCKEVFDSSNWQESTMYVTFYNIYNREKDNLPTLFKKIKKCADEANIPAACYYVYSLNIELKILDSTDAVEYLKRASDLGYELAQTRLASLYYYKTNDCGIKQDLKKAFELYEKSSSLNISKYHLGLLYYFGDVIKKDYKKAFEYFEATSADIKEAQLYLAHCYANGYGVKQDGKKALMYYQKLEKEGGYISYQVGIVYFKGIPNILESDNNKAIELLNLAEKEYKSASLYNKLGILFKRIGDYKKAISIYKKGLKIDKNHKDILYNLGVIYELSDNLEKDYKESLNYYLLAYEAGDINASLQIACLYLFDQYGLFDKNMAFKYLKIAYENKLEDSEVYLAYYYEHFEDNEKEAYSLIKDSKSTNHILYSTLGNLYYSGKFLARDYQKAFEYYQKAYDAFAENPYTWFRLGRCYYFGHGVERDVNRAYDFISQAKADDFQDAVIFYDEYFKNR